MVIPLLTLYTALSNIIAYNVVVCFFILFNNIFPQICILKIETICYAVKSPFSQTVNAFTLIS